MQTPRKNLKKYLIAVSFAIGVCMALFFVITAPVNYDGCDYYTEKLNGGVKEYQGRKFKFHLCGTGGDSMQSDDVIKLQVFDEKGDLVAMRHFVVNWIDSKLERGVEYHPDHITYYDESLDYDYKKNISMPPTTLDWIRARIPLLD